MAITLPKASPASGGEGGGGKKAQTFDASGVPTPPIAKDTGLTVPPPSVSGLEGVGAAISDVGAEIAATDARINKRKNGVARDRDDTLYF